MGDYRHNPLYMEDINRHLLFTVGSETKSETCLYNSLRHCTSLKVMPLIEGGWLTF